MFEFLKQKYMKLISSIFNNDMILSLKYEFIYILDGHIFNYREILDSCIFKFFTIKQINIIKY